MPAGRLGPDEVYALADAAGGPVPRPNANQLTLRSPLAGEAQREWFAETCP